MTLCVKHGQVVPPWVTALLSALLDSLSWRSLDEGNLDAHLLVAPPHSLVRWGCDFGDLRLLVWGLGLRPLRRRLDVRRPSRSQEVRVMQDRDDCRNCGDLLYRHHEVQTVVWDSDSGWVPSNMIRICPTAVYEAKG